MALITIENLDIPNWKQGGATVRLRIFADADFIANPNEVPIFNSGPESKEFYSEIICQVEGETIKVPEIALYSTTDSTDKLATYTAWIYKNGARKKLFLERFKLPHSLGEEITWESIIEYNALNRQKASDSAGSDGGADSEALIELTNTVANLREDLEGDYYVKSQVDAKDSAIGVNFNASLANFYNKTQVDAKDAATLASANASRMANHYEKSVVDAKDAAVLSTVNANLAANYYNRTAIDAFNAALADAIGSNTPPTDAPPAATGLSGILNGQQIRWKWTRPNSSYIKGFNLYRGSAFVGFVDSDNYSEAVADNLSLTVKSVGTNGLESAGVTAGFTLQAPLPPSGYSVALVGNLLRHKLNSVAGLLYEFASANDDTGILNTNNSDGIYDEPNFSTISRTVTRYARSLRNGIASAWVSAQVTINAPEKPTLIKDAQITDNPFQVRVKINTGTNRNLIKQTLVQTRKAGGSFPANHQPATSGNLFLTGAPSTVILDGRQGETWEIRVLHSDDFGNSEFSDVLAHEFPIIVAAPDINSPAFQKSATNDPIRTGGGTFSFTS